MFMRAIVAGLVLGCFVSCGSPGALRKSSRTPTPQAAEIAADRGPAHIPNQWFYGQRAGQSGTIPFRARTRAMQASRQAGVTPAPGAWVNAGPFNVGGRVTAIAADPNDSQRFWVGTAAGGVFLTEDEGVTFSPVFDDQVALSIGSIVTHPTDSDIVYVGTGEDNGGGLSYDGEGVYKTTDGGQTWTPMGLAEVRRIGKIAVDPTDGDRIYVAAGGDWFNTGPDRGIYRSTDGGNTWTRVLYVSDDAGGCDVVVHPLNPDIVFAAIWQHQSQGDDWYIGGSSGGIYRSTDGGDNWTRLTAGLPESVGRIGLALAPTEPDWVYANVMHPIGSLDGIYRTEDGGDTWSLRAGPTIGGFFTTYSYYFSQIRVDPLDANTIYALDQRLNKSTTGGQSVFRIANVVHVDWHDLIVEPGGRIIAGTDGGFFVSQDFGETWFHSVTLPITQFYDLGIDHLDPQRRFAGAQDNGTVRTTDSGLSNWVNVLGGDGLQTEVDYTDSNKVYASAQYGLLARSVNGGDSFMWSTDGIAEERTHWNAPYVLDPVVPTTLYTATYRVYRSTDSAVSWTAISPDLTNGPPPATLEADHVDDHDDGDNRQAGRHVAPGRRTSRTGQTHLENLIRGTVTVVHVSPADHNVIWAGTDDGNVWVSESAGFAWTQVTPPGLAYWVTDIAADPIDRESAYLTVTGYREGDKMPYVRATSDLGATWRDATGNLPQVPANSILVDLSWRGRLFVGNDLGVYVSDDDGGNWSVMRGGMPYVVVADLVLHEPSDTLYAGSFARSVFTFDLNQLPDADGDLDGVDNNADCAPFDGSAFAEPGEVGVLTVDRGPDGESLLSWDDASATSGNGTVYDVALGSLSDLHGAGTQVSGMLECSVAGLASIDSAVPPLNDPVFYIVRASNACADGAWGSDSEGSGRRSSACL